MAQSQLGLTDRVTVLLETRSKQSARTVLRSVGTDEIVTLERDDANAKLVFS